VPEARRARARPIRVFFGRLIVAFSVRVAISASSSASSSASFLPLLPQLVCRKQPELR